MPMLTETRFSFDAATAISKGARDYQEDAIVSDVTYGAELSFVVLADGMGGHAAGDIASQIVVTEVFRALTFMRSEMVASRPCVQETLRDAASAANDRLRAHVAAHPDCHGMGATLVAVVLIGGDLYWISIGDSPLFLFRNDTLIQLNEDHSMSRAIDTMVDAGALSEEEGANHPDRNVLTSVLYGKPVPTIDCPAAPKSLQGGDMLIVASDGLKFLTNTHIEKVLRARPLSGSGEVAAALLTELEDLDDPDLDNASMSIIKVTTSEARKPGLKAPVMATPEPQASVLTKLFATHRIRLEQSHD